MLRDYFHAEIKPSDYTYVGPNFALPSRGLIKGFNGPSHIFARLDVIESSVLLISYTNRPWI